jgi:hypothetical protein
VRPLSQGVLFRAGSQGLRACRGAAGAVPYTGFAPVWTWGIVPVAAQSEGGACCGAAGGACCAAAEWDLLVDFGPRESFLCPEKTGLRALYAKNPGGRPAGLSVHMLCSGCRCSGAGESFLCPEKTGLRALYANNPGGRLAGLSVHMLCSGCRCSCAGGVGWGGLSLEVRDLPGICSARAGTAAKLPGLTVRAGRVCRSALGDATRCRTGARPWPSAHVCARIPRFPSAAWRYPFRSSH